MVRWPLSQPLLGSRSRCNTGRIRVLHQGSWYNMPHLAQVPDRRVEVHDTQSSSVICPHRAREPAIGNVATWATPGPSVRCNCHLASHLDPRHTPRACEFAYTSLSIGPHRLSIPGPRCRRRGLRDTTPNSTEMRHILPHPRYLAREDLLTGRPVAPRSAPLPVCAQPPADRLQWQINQMPRLNMKRQHPRLPHSP